MHKHTVIYDQTVAAMANDIAEHKYDMPERIWGHVGPILRFIRTQRGLTATALAEIVRKEENECKDGPRDSKIDVSYISKLENRGVNISITRFEAFCRALGCSPGEVLRLAEDLARKHRELATRGLKKQALERIRAHKMKGQ